MSIKDISKEQHNIEIQQNLENWRNKPVLQKIYMDFYKLIASKLSQQQGKIVELGSGIGNMKMFIPEVITTDLFANPWIDQVENAYKLSFENESVSNLILFDVFHHLEFPGTALIEFNRVLKKRGRIIIFDPAMSLLGILVYGIFHHEPIAITKKIKWFSDENTDLQNSRYYAAQSNASRVFNSVKYKKDLTDWYLAEVKKLSAISYILSGGYSKRQLFPDSASLFLNKTEKFFDLFPVLFATRLLVVLEKI